MLRTLIGALALVAGLTVAEPMSQISRDYVRLVLALGAHDKDYVDAYYGPGDIKTEAEQAKLSLDDIGKNAKTLGEQLKRLAEGIRATYAAEQKE